MAITKTYFLGLCNDLYNILFRFYSNEAGITLVYENFGPKVTREDVDEEFRCFFGLPRDTTFPNPYQKLRARIESEIEKEIKTKSERRDTLFFLQSQGHHLRERLRNISKHMEDNNLYSMSQISGDEMEKLLTPKGKKIVLDPPTPQKATKEYWNNYPTDSFIPSKASINWSEVLTQMA